jgi:predicted RNase H-like nuclease (RuvC/YqgF family)
VNLIDMAGIAGLVMGMAAIITALIARYKAPAERSQTQAGTAEIYDRIAQGAAVRALKLNERVDALEIENNLLKTRIIRQDEMIADLRDLADRLAHQVQSLGGTAVKIRKDEDET